MFFIVITQAHESEGQGLSLISCFITLLGKISISFVVKIEVSAILSNLLSRKSLLFCLSEVKPLNLKILIESFSFQTIFQEAENIP